MYRLITIILLDRTYIEVMVDEFSTVDELRRDLERNSLIKDSDGEVVLGFPHMGMMRSAPFAFNDGDVFYLRKKLPLQLRSNIEKPKTNMSEEEHEAAI